MFYSLLFKSTFKSTFYTIKFDYMKIKDKIINVINYPAHINTINDIIVSDSYLSIS